MVGSLAGRLPARFRWPIVSSLTAVALAALALLLIVVYTSGRPNISGPVLGSVGGRPLPPGPPAYGTSEALVERVPLARMIAEAGVVFVGRVSEIGGSEVVSPAAPTGFGSRSSHRTRFSVIDQLRGPTAERIDISVLDLPQFDVFEIGQEYLVFAEWRELGTMHMRALVPSGYDQGVYRMIDDAQASNEYNGTVNIGTLPREPQGAAR